MFDDEMLTIDEVAAYLKLKPQTIYKWAQKGKIPGAKFGKEWRFRRSTIEDWIDQQIELQASTDASGRDRASEGRGERSQSRSSAEPRAKSPSSNAAPGPNSN